MSLLILLNGIIISALVFTALWSVKLYRRFFIVLDRKTDAVDFALAELRIERGKHVELQEKLGMLELEFKNYKSKEAAKRLR